MISYFGMISYSHPYICGNTQGMDVWCGPGWYHCMGANATGVSWISNQNRRKLLSMTMHHHEACACFRMVPLHRDKIGSPVAAVRNEGQLRSQGAGRIPVWSGKISQAQNNSRIDDMGGQGVGSS
jgi:hypothetical protein